MVLLQALFLGIVQGLTEFIPISSSAHLIIIPWLFGWNDSVLTSLSFDVSLHLGTLLALLTYFAQDWLRLIGAFFVSIWERRIGADLDRRLAWYLAAGSVPGILAGVLAESEIERVFHGPDTSPPLAAMVVMAVIISMLALAMFLVERLIRHTRPLASVTMKDSLLIGLAQALAIFPGVSRSGATITAGLAMGFERADAARFSFLLGAPIIAGAGLKTIWDMFHAMQSGGGYTSVEWALFIIGMLSASVSGYLCIKYLLRYLQRNSTDIFAYYRWGLAIVIIVAALYRR